MLLADTDVLVDIRDSIVAYRTHRAHRIARIARSALRELTRRMCPNEESEANVVSYATGHETEHRRAVPERSAGTKQRSADGRPLTISRANDQR